MIPLAYFFFSKKKSHVGLGLILNCTYYIKNAGCIYFYLIVKKKRRLIIKRPTSQNTKIHCVNSSRDE